MQIFIVIRVEKSMHLVNFFLLCLLSALCENYAFFFNGQFHRIMHNSVEF